MRLNVIERHPEGKPRRTPLLFIHGAWHQAVGWDEHFMPYFAQHGYATYALDLRGHGRSEGAVRWSSLADYAADVAQVAAALPAPPVLIGHSMGGLVVQKYLETHAAPAAVLMASVPYNGSLRYLLKVTLRHPLQAALTFATLSPRHILGTPALLKEACYSPDMPDAQVRGYFDFVVDESMRMIFDSALLALPRVDKIRAQRVPMLVLAAEDDFFFTTAEEHATARVYDADYRQFPRMAHNMMQEANWRAPADHIRDWLASRQL